MTTAVFPGSFDPPTFGHLDIIKRASAIFDELVVCVMSNGLKFGSLFSPAERVKLLKIITKEIPNTRIECDCGLLVDYIKKFEKPIIIRGLRAVTDFEYEFQMSSVNKKFDPQLETMFMVANNEYTFLSSSIVREFGKYRKKMTCLVPEAVEKAVFEKFSQGEL